MNEDINLIGSTKKKQAYVPDKKVQYMRIIAMVLLFGISATSIILFILVSLSPLPKLKQEEQMLTTTLAASNSTIGKLLLLDERISAASTILSKRKQYDVLLQLLQNHMKSDMKITTIRIDKNVMLVSVSSKSLQVLDEFLATLLTTVRKESVFTSITMNDLSTQESSHLYIMSLNFVLK